MAQNVEAFGPPATTSQKLRAMKAKTEAFFSTEKPHSIMAMASRLSTNGNRKYTCRREDGGVRVWRTK